MQLLMMAEECQLYYQIGSVYLYLYNTPFEAAVSFSGSLVHLYQECWPQLKKNISLWHLVDTNISCISSAAQLSSNSVISVLLH